MSMFFRSRPSRRPGRPVAGAAPHKIPAAAPHLTSNPVADPLGAPRAASAPVRANPRKRGQRPVGYRIAGTPNQRMFRVN
jgi:hypothetical protein